jgi:signal transduction histidine kinase
VARALSYDAEEKAIRVDINVGPSVIEADEQLLRQTLFNLILNAIQAVGKNASVSVSARLADGAVTLDIADTGPGVPDERRTQIFKPYFTTDEHGTGLGLAVVRQIVLAHGWKIECLPNEPVGAIFRITHIRAKA